MDHPLQSHIDRIVAAAEKRGELDNLPGAGKPLTDTRDPHDALISRLMSEASVKHPIAVIREQLTEARATLATLSDDDDRRAEMLHIADLELKLALELEALRRYG